ncbi:MAG: hypothetical protein WAV47_10250 [Blastocatellia bacterium]
MSDMFVMRRANGDLFTEEINGKPRVLVWSSEEALARSKERNPELMTFLPARLTRSLIHGTGSGLAVEEPALFLLDEDDPQADLDDGRPISLEEIFPTGERTLQPA